ncbi:MAG TPA: HD domain-containing phosphohydrolase, partial [Candidatus Sulfotelmatobacter sp.]|nr:HD domain-containing phosphohydrolase [Candidatus Sulfotelmatobacter sp.]
ILLTPDSPVTPELLKRLQKWKYSQVRTDGKPKDVPGHMAKTSSGSPGTKTIDDDIQQTARNDAAQRFHAELTLFADGLFTKYSLEGTIGLAQATEWIKKTIQMIHESRDALLQFLDVSAEGDRYLITHAVNTTILALAIGDYLKMPAHRLIELGQACVLHEIGMLKLPPELRRATHSLSPEERKAMSTHTVLGYRILKGISAPENVALAALEHHERIDGSGYPRALAMPKISEYALIIGVVCSYDAMMSRRPFRPGSLDGHNIIRDLALKNRKQYDERILKALVYTLSVYPIGTAVLLSDGSKGVVVKTDPARPRCPVVRVVRDPDGRQLPEPAMVQVSDSEGITIGGVLPPEEAQQVKEQA